MEQQKHVKQGKQKYPMLALQAGICSICSICAITENMLSAQLLKS
jgi:hypothetical protein